jgi:hypothetical protein
VTARRTKRTIDVGIATIVAALITALGAITTAVLATVLPHVTASSPAPVPTVTVTKYASASVTSTPTPAVTVTAQPRTTSSGRGIAAWTEVAAVMTAAVGLGTLTLGFDAVVRRWGDQGWAGEPDAEQPDSD